MDGAGRRPALLRRVVATGTRWPRRWWARQSLRARLTLLATTLFSVAVITGAVLLVLLQQRALTRVLDQSALKAAGDVANLARAGKLSDPIVPTTGGIAAIQYVSEQDQVSAASAGADRAISLVTPDQLEQVRDGARLDVAGSSPGVKLRVVARAVGKQTVLVFTDTSRVEDSVQVLTEAAAIGAPVAVLLMALASYSVVGLTLRSVASLRHGAADITAAGLARQRLPVPGARDEIHRLAVTLNAMLDRIDSATSRQRTFVGDAAHELRSPLASLRVQLEVAARMADEITLSEVVDDVLIDVDRLDRLVGDLLALARLDEASGPRRREPVALDELVTSVTDGYGHARVPLEVVVDPVTVPGDPDALRRVVINLIDNAVRYASTGVTVRLVRHAHGGRSSARLTVQDDGPGIPADERQRVFDRFYRVHESRSRDSGGTGLGLPIVRDVVVNHGGRVVLSERPDGAPGLTAVVTLPI